MYARKTTASFAHRSNHQEFSLHSDFQKNSSNKFVDHEDDDDEDDPNDSSYVDESDSDDSLNKKMPAKTIISENKNKQYSTETSPRNISLIDGSLFHKNPKVVETSKAMTKPKNKQPKPPPKFDLFHYLFNDNMDSIMVAINKTEWNSAQEFWTENIQCASTIVNCLQFINFLMFYAMIGDNKKFKQIISSNSIPNTNLPKLRQELRENPSNVSSVYNILFSITFLS